MIAGRFVIDRRASTGGMSTVFRARDLATGAIVALKILDAVSEEDVARFAQEAAILAGLDHPGIVRYLHHGTSDRGEHYLAMEWLEGEDLEARLSRARLSDAEAMLVMRGAAEALAFAHARGVVHRDVKPSNLFLVGGDPAQLKLVDFGIATAAGAPSIRAARFVGTPAYTAPERVLGDALGDARADVFSLGCVFFECLTGRAAFAGEYVFAVLTKLQLQRAPMLRELRPDLPPGLDALVSRMLSKAKEERPPDARAVLAELDRAEERAAPAPADAEPISAVGSSRRTAPLSARRARTLTRAEQRFVTIVLAGQPGEEPPPADELRAAADPYGGCLHEIFYGAFVVTAWGAGTPLDRAERAALCALALRARAPALPLAVVSGRGLLSARVVEGDLIDRAAALLAPGEDGGVAIDAATAELLRPRYRVDPAGRAFVLRGERPFHEVAPRLLGRDTPCLGRAPELAAFDRMLAVCVTEPEATAVLITGPAGSGKSRLAQEMVARARARPEAIEILSGRASALGAGSPFGTVADAVARAAGIRDGEPMTTRWQKLLVWLRRKLAGPAAARAASLLGELVGAPLPERDQPFRDAHHNPMVVADAMRAAWEELLTAQCAGGGLVLVLEDFHWGDAATVRLVADLLRALAEAPLFVLALARPEIEERFPALWSGRLQHIKLGPLPRRASERMVLDAVGQTASAIEVDEIVARAAGNPFYIEELVRSVAAGRREAFPDTVLGAIEARLDAEGPEAKRALRAAAVFGERFTALGVAALLGDPPPSRETKRILEQLTWSELVAAAGPAGADDEAFVFRHALVREAAYRMLTAPDRALGHGLAGDWLEQNGFADAAVIAEHFRSGAEPARAVPWYRRAAEIALAADHLTSACERAAAGIACGAAGEDRGALELVDAEASAWRGDLARAEASAAAAVESLGVGSPLWYRAVTQLVTTLGKQGAFDRVERWPAPVIAADPRAGAGPARLACLCECANQLTFGGRYAAAEEIARAVDRDAPGVDADPQLDALIAQMRAIRALFTGDLGAAVGHFDVALGAFDRAGDRRDACVVRQNLGATLAELGDFAKAEGLLRTAASVAEDMGLADLATVALMNLGNVVALRGDRAGGKGLLAAAIDAFDAHGQVRMKGIAKSYLAKIALSSGDAPSAEIEARAATDLLRTAPPHLAVAAAVLSRALLRLGRRDEALAAAREAFTTLEELGSLEEGEALVGIAWAEALAASGAAEEARHAIGRGCDRLRARAHRIADPSWRARFLEHVPENAETIALFAAIAPGA